MTLYLTSRSFSDIGSERGMLIFRSRGLHILFNTPHGRQTKVALRCSDEEEMRLLQAKAQSLNLCARSIQDA